MIRGMSKCTQLGNGFTDHVFGRKLSVFFQLFYHTSGHVWDHCEYINISSVCYYTRPDIRETRGKRAKTTGPRELHVIKNITLIVM